MSGKKSKRVYHIGKPFSNRQLLLIVAVNAQQPSFFFLPPVAFGAALGLVGSLSFGVGIEAAKSIPADCDCTLPPKYAHTAFILANESTCDASGFSGNWGKRMADFHSSKPPKRI